MASSPPVSAPPSSSPRVVMPPFPTSNENPSATMPPVDSPAPETVEAAEKKGDSTPEIGEAVAHESEANASDPVVASPSMPVVIQPSAEDDVFAPENEVAKRITQSLTSTTYKGFMPRADRVKQAPSALNAQGLYPPDALIFVANLSTKRSEDQLVVACHQAFDGFGVVHIKVRLDRNGHPFAFLQYEKAEDAEAAMKGAVGLLIDGRKIRVERAKAERAVMLTKTNGCVVSVAEARSLLERYGPIEKSVATIMGTRVPFCAGGVYVKFAYYLDCRDALRLFSNHTNGYALHLAPTLEPRFRKIHDGTTVIKGFSNPRSAVDQKSIYVGNLPNGTTKEVLWGLFEEYGNIVDANVIARNYDNNDGRTVFGFVQFSTEDEAETAAGAERWIDDHKLRVEPKEYSARRPHRPTSVPAPRVPQAPKFRHAIHFNNPGPYQAGVQMTPPHTSYGGNMGMPIYNHFQGHPPFATPPNNQMMMPMGMYGQTPPYALGQAPVPFKLGQPPTPYYGGYHQMGPIPESGEEGNY